MKKISMILAVLAFSAACGIPVSQECTDVMALTDDDCAGGQAIADAFPEATYGAGGTCWQNQATADACTDACKVNLDNCSGGGDAGT